MIMNFYIKCCACNTKFRLRWQIGYPFVSVAFQCPSCNTNISGFVQDKSHFEFVKEFKNGIDCLDEITNNFADYVVEISSEFFTKKIKKDGALDVSPFMRSSYVIKDNDYFNKVCQYGFKIKELKDNVSLIYSLFLNNKWDVLSKQLEKSNDIFVQSTKNKNKELYEKHNYFEFIHNYLKLHINFLCFESIYKRVCEIEQDIKSIYHLNKESLEEFCNKLSEDKQFVLLENKFKILLLDYMDLYRGLLPIYFKKDITTIDMNELGLSTNSINDLLHFYKNAYEFLGEFIVIIIGLNNISTRGNANKFMNKEKDVFETINKISSKVNRFNDYLKNGEIFTNDFVGGLNNIIRNSEAHFDMFFDPITQKIIFKNKKENNVTVLEKYMLEFSKDVIDIFQKCIILWEISFQLQKKQMNYVLHYRK